MFTFVSRLTSTILSAALCSYAAAPIFIKTMPLGPQPPFSFPQQMAVNVGTNRVYAFNGNSIAAIDTSTNTFRSTLTPTLPAGMSLVALTETRNAVKGFAVNTPINVVYAAYSNTSAGTVISIDASTDTILHTVNLSFAISNLAVNPATNKLYVMSSGAAAQIVVMNGSTLAQTGIIAGAKSGPLAINPANNKIYAAAAGTSFGVAVIDGTKDIVAGLTPLPADTYDLMVNPATNHMYAKPNATQAVPDFAVYKIDGVTNALDASINSPFAPSLGFNANFTFVDAVGNKVYSGLAIDGTTDAVTPGLPAFEYTLTPTLPLTCQSLSGLAVDFTNGNMYAGCDGDLVVADNTTGIIKALVPVNYVVTWNQIAVNPANHAVYGLSPSSSMATLDPVSLTTSLVQLGNPGGGMAANPGLNRVYVTDLPSSAELVLDGTANTFTSKVFAQLGSMAGSAFQIDGALSVAVNKTTNQYVAVGGSGGMVFDGVTNAPVVPIRPQLVSGPGGLSGPQFDFASIIEPTNKMYSADFSAGDTVYVTNLATGVASTFANPFLKTGEICTIRGLITNSAQNWVYVSAVCQTASPVIFIYDGTTGATLQTVDVGANIPTGSNIGDLLLNPKTNKLYVTNYGGFNVASGTGIPTSTEVYNAVTMAHIGSIPSVTGPMAVDTVLNAIYGVSDPNALSGAGTSGAVIDGNTDTLSSTFPLGFAVSSTERNPIAVNEDTAMVYYMNRDPGVVSIFQGNLPSPGSFAVSGKISAAAPAGITVKAQGATTATAITDPTGAFSLAGLPPGAYSVTPATAGLFYSPASASVNVTTANVTGVNFIALSNPVAVTGMTLSPWSMIAAGVTTTATVTLNQAAPTGGIVVNVTANNSKAKVPATLTIPAGSTSAAFSVQASGVNAPTNVAITATYQGSLASQPSSASVNLVIAPTDSVRVSSATYSLSTGALQVSATSTNPLAILTVFNSSNNQNLGTMVNQGAGNYTFQSKPGSPPASITVKSNLDGQSGQGVKQVP